MEMSHAVENSKLRAITRAYTPTRIVPGFPYRVHAVDTDRPHKQYKIAAQVIILENILQLSTGSTGTPFHVDLRLFNGPVLPRFPGKLKNLSRSSQS